MATFDAVIARRLADAATQQLAKRVADTAEAELRRALAGPKPPTNVTAVVDGRPGAPLTSVKPDGEIRIELHYLDLVVAGILALVREGAPHGGPKPSGQLHYVEQIVVTYDGVRVEEPLPSVPPGAQVLVTDTALYASKIEHGESVQAPDGVFELAARSAQRQWGNSAVIEFGYSGLSDLGVPVHQAEVASHPPSVRRHLNHSENRYPTITIRAR